MARFSNYPFRSEAEASDFLERMRWPGGVTCPVCGNKDRPIHNRSQSRGVASRRNPDGKMRHGLKKCSACRSEFRSTFGTPFHGLKVPLDVLLAAIVLHHNSQVRSISELSRALGIKRDTVARILVAADENELLRRQRLADDMTMSAFSLSLESSPNSRF